MQQIEADRAGAAPHHPLIALGVRRFVLITAVLAIVSYVVLYTRPDAPAPIRSDGYSYYVYLPSWVLYRDVTLDGLALDWYGGRYPAFSAITRWPATGRWINPHPIGPAVLMSPIFGAAHALTRWSNLPPDGFSTYYQHGAGLAGLAWFLAGLGALRALLRRYFDDAIVLATLVTITWGTNLFHYGVYDSVFSHGFSFSLISTFLLLTDRWWRSSTSGLSLFVGLVAGGIVLCRHTNSLFLLLFPFFGVTDGRSARQRFTELWLRRREVTIAAIAGAAVVLPQLAIYKAATGSWLVSPYRGLGVGFTFTSPHLVDVLFSPQKGLFFWSPVLLLACAGFLVARSIARAFRLAAIVVLAADTYLIASWWDWQLGGSYGHRGFTDAVGLLALFLAAFFSWTARHPRVKPFVVVAASAAVGLSVIQMAQYWLGIIPIANTTWAQYRAIFLTFR
jgi:hypothetical protein